MSAHDDHNHADNENSKNGGTGFLFGNVDRKGRLDEEYLPEDAKDNLDNIGNQVTEKNRELTEIRQALPGDKNADPNSIVTPSAHQSAPQIPKQDDVYEESDGEMELDEEERAQYAQHALKSSSVQKQHQSSKLADDDEDYDELDDEEDNDQKPTTTAVPTATPIPSPTTASTQAPSATLPQHQQQIKPNSISNVAPSGKEPALSSSPSKRFQGQEKENPQLIQQRLIEQAKASRQQHQTTSLSKSLQKKETKPSDKEDDPILFSVLFARSPPKINFNRPPRHTYGVNAPSLDLPPPCADDSDRLLRPKSPVEVDPIAHALEADAKNRQLLFPSTPEIRPRVVNIESCPDYEQASAPLLNALKTEPKPEPKHEPKREPKHEPELYVAHDKSEKQLQTQKPQSPEPKPLLPTLRQESEETKTKVPAPFQLMDWEDDVLWKDDDDNDNNDSKWFTDDLSAKSAILTNASSDNNAMAVEDSDEDEFEDAVVINPIGSVQPSKPTTTTAPANDSEDDEDDMEWEDGGMSASDNMNVSSNDKSTQASASDMNSDHGLSSQGMRSSQGSDANKSSTNNKNHASSSKVTKLSSTTSLTAPNAKSIVQNSTNANKSSSIPVIDIRGHSRQSDEGGNIIKKVIAPNKDLANGLWVHGIVWNSDSESDPYDSETDSEWNIPRQMRNCLNHLILDMNDPNMVFEHLMENSSEVSVGQEREKPSQDIVTLGKDKLLSLLSSSGAQLYQTLQGDRFNISNDVYYASGTAQHFKLDRGPSTRRLQDAPPALKIQTAPSFLSTDELLSYRRPKLSNEKIPKNMTLVPLRRKRVKGGNAQIAGQIPKKKVELRCCEKDAYRVSVFEYALERQPCLLPIPGMASRLRTYARKETAEEVQRADQASAGTPNAGTVFMGPDEPPPLAAGNIEANDKPLCVLESQLYVAPCAKHDAQPTDFLLVRHGKNMYVREIDSMVSIGLTEPKVDVMTPNTERYKKYGRERVYLWVMREFQRMRKEIDKEKKRSKGHDDEKSLRNPPFLEKEEVFAEFPRRRTYPETALNRALKDFGKFQNGKYVQNEEVVGQYGNKEQEMMRVLTPIETAAFESMESGWTHLFDRGIIHFTHPSQQGNILAAAEADRSGLESGPAVGKYIKSHLLKSPWYRSVNILSAHRVQRKDLLQALALARIVNDLKEGGEVMEAKLQTLTPTDMSNVLTAVFKHNSKKIPADLEDRRSLIRELCQKKGKGAPSPEVSDYATIIRNVLKRHRDAGLSKGAAIAAMGTSMAGGTFLGIPLPIQRKALEEGDVSELPAEEDDFVPDENAARYAAEYEQSELSRQQKKEEENSQKRLTKKGRPLSANGPNKTGEGDSMGDALQRDRGPFDGHMSQPLPGTNGLGGAGGNAGMNKSSAGGGDMSKNEPSASGGIKIAIDMKKLGQAGFKKKSGGGAEKPRSKMKYSEVKDDGGKAGDGGKTKKSAENKGQIGKIKINTKKLHRDKEQAALKRKRAQYSDDIDYRAKKAPKTSRKKRNGTVELNSILERIENTVRTTEGFVDPTVTTMIRIARLRNGESPPPNVMAKNLANPIGTGLDFLTAVDTKMVPTYKDIIKKQMYLNLIRINCKQMKYKKASEFLDDMKLILTNAKTFHRDPSVQWVVQHAELLYEVAVEEASKHADEIKSAEDMVALEELETRGSGAGPSKKNKNKSKAKGTGSAEKKKKKLVKETITIPDDNEVTEVPQPALNTGAGITDDIYEVTPSMEGGAGDGISSDVVLHLDD